MQASFRVTRNSENTFKAEIVDEQGRAIFEFPIETVKVSDSATYGPFELTFDAKLV